MQKQALCVCILFCLLAVGNCHFWNKWFTSSSEEDSSELKDLGFFNRWLQKLKTYGSKYLPKVGIRYAWRTKTVCKYVRCYSYGNDYDECAVPDYGTASSVSIKNLKPRSRRCIKGHSYGLDDNKIWVAKNCKAVFTVCYNEKQTTTTTAATRPPTTTTTTEIPIEWHETTGRPILSKTTPPPTTKITSRKPQTTTRIPTTKVPTTLPTTTTTMTTRTPKTTPAVTSTVETKTTPVLTPRMATKPKPKPECRTSNGFCSPVCPESYPPTDEAVCLHGLLCCHMPTVQECGAPPYSGSDKTGYSIILGGTQEGDEAVYRCSEGPNRGAESILVCEGGSWKPALDLNC